MHFTPSGTEASTKTSFFGLTDAVTFSPPGRIPLLASPPALAIRLQTAPQRAMPRATCIRTVDGLSASFYNAAFEEATRRVAVSQRIRRYEKIGFRSLTVAALFLQFIGLQHDESC